MQKLTDRQQDIADAMMVGDRARVFYLRELERLNVHNEPVPDCCPTCGNELECAGGMVGEAVLYCKAHGVAWTDHEGAIAAVL